MNKLAVVIHFIYYLLLENSGNGWRLKRDWKFGSNKSVRQDKDDQPDQRSNRQTISRKNVENNPKEHYYLREDNRKNESVNIVMEFGVKPPWSSSFKTKETVGANCRKETAKGSSGN